MLRIILISIFICLTYLASSILSASDNYENENRPYEFGFKIENNQHRYEKRDKNGLVMGEFGFVTADGIYHATVYATDEKGSFNIVSMQNLKIEDIVDLFKIPRQSPKPKFEIVPLKATTPSSYNSLVSTPKPNTPVIESKKVDPTKSCSNCKVPTTKRPKPITFAPIQRNTQKPFGVGLPEKLTTYQQFDVTKNPIVPSINSVAVPIKVSNDQIPVTPTQSTLKIAQDGKLNPQPSQNISTTPDQFVGTVIDSIQKVSLQQSNVKPKLPENLPVTQNAEETDPLLGPIPENILQPSKPISPPRFQLSTPLPGLSQTVQSSLINSKPIEEPQIYIGPLVAPKIQLTGPVNPIRESKQPQVLTTFPIEQPPVYTEVTNLSPTQRDTHPDIPEGSIRESEGLETPQPQRAINAAVDQAIKLNAPPRSPEIQLNGSPASTFKPSTSKPSQIEVVNQPILLNIPSKPLRVQSDQPSGSIHQPPAQIPTQLEGLDIPQSQPPSNPATNQQNMSNVPSRPSEILILGLNSPLPQKPTDSAINQPTIFNTPLQVSKIPADRSSSFMNKPPSSTSTQFEGVDNPQSQQPHNYAVNQPTISNSPTKPSEIQLDRLSGLINKPPVTISAQVGSLDSPQPQQLPNSATKQPNISIIPSGPSEIQSDRSDSTGKQPLAPILSPITPQSYSPQPQQPPNSATKQPNISIIPSGPSEIQSDRSDSTGKQPSAPILSPITPQSYSPQPQQPPNSATKQPKISIIPSGPSEIQPDRSVPIHFEGLNRPSSQEPHIIAINQPAILNVTSKLMPIKSENTPSKLRGSVQFSPPQLPQLSADNQPQVLKKPSTSTLSEQHLPQQRQPSENIKSQDLHVVSGPVQNIQPVQGNRTTPIKYETSYPVNKPLQSTNPSPVPPTGSKIENPVTNTFNDISRVAYIGDVKKYPTIPETDNDNVLVVEPLSPSPEVRINLPKQLVNSPPRQIYKVPQPTLTEFKENVSTQKSVPSQSVVGSVEPSIGRYDKGINTAKMEQILGNILYRFNYTSGYHGHHEHGDNDGNKEGGYYLITRDGYRRIVDYTANEDGYRPRVHIEYAQPQEVPVVETEKEKGLGGYEFKWFYVR